MILGSAYREVRAINETGQALDITPAELFDCVMATWSPTIGDPSFIGWFTVFAYFAAATLCLRAGRRRAGRERVFWNVLSALMYALAVNKQLDLQSAFTATGRCLAKAQGWYGERRIFQVEFIFGIAATSVALMIVLFWWLRAYLSRTWLALLGLGTLLAFIAIRAAGFHHVDHLINVRFIGIRMNWILEIGGIAMIGVNAAIIPARTGRHRRGQREDFSAATGPEKL